MSPLLWLRRIFTPPETSDEEQDNAAMRELDEETSVWNEHMRILLAILVALVGALMLWWIMA